MRTLLSLLLFTSLLGTASCTCNERPPLDAMSTGPDLLSVSDFSDSSDLSSSLDADICIACSQTETTPECTPTRCGLRNGRFCCNVAKSR